MQAVIIVLAFIGAIVLLDIANDKAIREKGGIPQPHIWEVPIKEIFEID